MADEYIRRQDAVEAMCKATCGGKGGCPAYPCEETIQPLIDLPSANVVPVAHGEWIHMGCGIFECDKCGERISTNVYVREEASERFKFCPNCGAKMDGGDEHG